MPCIYLTFSSVTTNRLSKNRKKTQKMNASNSQAANSAQTIAAKPRGLKPDGQGQPWWCVQSPWTLGWRCWCFQDTRGSEIPLWLANHVDWQREESLHRLPLWIFIFQWQGQVEILEIKGSVKNRVKKVTALSCYFISFFYIYNVQDFKCIISYTVKKLLYRILLLFFTENFTKILQNYRSFTILKSGQKASNYRKMATNVQEQKKEKYVIETFFTIYFAPFF